MTISIQGVSFDCTNFRSKGAVITKRVVVYPIGYVDDFDDRGRKDTHIYYGCNLYYDCECAACSQSRVSRDNAKGRRAGEVVR